jgi:hypothetical protein
LYKPLKYGWFVLVSTTLVGFNGTAGRMQAISISTHAQIKSNSNNCKRNIKISKPGLPGPNDKTTSSLAR